MVENKYKDNIYFGFSFVYVLTTCEDLAYVGGIYKVLVKAAAADEMTGSRGSANNDARSPLWFPVHVQKATKPRSGDESWGACLDKRIILISEFSILCSCSRAGGRRERGRTRDSHLSHVTFMVDKT